MCIANHKTGPSRSSLQRNLQAVQQSTEPYRYALLRRGPEHPAQGFPEGESLIQSLHAYAARSLHQTARPWPKQHGRDEFPSSEGRSQW